MRINKQCPSRIRPAMPRLLPLVLLVFALLPSNALGASQSRKAATDCPRHWIRYERTKSCFHVIEQRLRWDEAEAYCNRQGGHLASLVDEYENFFAYDVAKKANLSNPTVWLGRLTRLTKTGAYEWHDGAIGRHSEGFKGDPPSGTDRCLTMWLDFDGPERSWLEWDCGYATGYSGLCKKSFKYRPTQQTLQVTASPLLHQARRCCFSLPCPFSPRCLPTERCIPDDLNCWTRTCENGAPGWCLPRP